MLDEAKAGAHSRNSLTGDGWLSEKQALGFAAAGCVVRIDLCRRSSDSRLKQAGSGLPRCDLADIVNFQRTISTI